MGSAKITVAAGVVALVSNELSVSGVSFAEFDSELTQQIAAAIATELQVATEFVEVRQIAVLLVAAIATNALLHRWLYADKAPSLGSPRQPCAAISLLWSCLSSSGFVRASSMVAHL